jgi:SAM-dependent methyltransferase
MKPELFDLHAEIEQRHWWFVARRQIVQRLLGRVVPPDDRPLVVDVGCGTGATLAALADRYRCVGIDPTAQGVELAKKRFPQVRFICGQAPEDLGESAGRADAFLLMDVLEHVPDDFHLFSSLLAASRSGAHFLVTVPAVPALWSEHDESFGHYRRYTPGRLAQVWEGLPVTARLVSYFNSRLYPVVRTVRMLNRLRGHAGGRAGTDLRLPPAPLNRLLQRIFAHEADGLLRSIDRSRVRSFPPGVSLVAVIRREPGTIVPRRRPTGIVPDRFDPAASRPAA